MMRPVSAARSIEHGSKPSRDVATFLQYMAEGAPRPHYYAVLLGLQTFEWWRLVQSIERGFRYETLEHLQRNTGMDADALLEWIQMAPRTQARRKQQGRLLPEESDRVFRAARIFGRSLELFDGDRAGALGWLFTNLPALGGATPIDVSRTELGAREVENLIGRLERGVYS